MDRIDGAGTHDAAWEDLGSQIAAIGCAAGLGPVFGAGCPQARLVLVGEAPGETEAREGRPFVGASGRLLDRALDRAGLSREQVWVTNVVKCRPVRDENGRWRNRAPTVAETRLWRPLLDAELTLIAPRLIVCLGAVAARALIDPSFLMGRDRGRWTKAASGEMAMGTFHPAYLLRLQGEERDTAEAAFEADLRSAREHLDAIPR